MPKFCYANQKVFTEFTNCQISLHNASKETDRGHGPAGHGP